MSDTNKDGVTDISEAVAGGPEHIAAQQQKAAEDAAKEAARAAEATANAKYPREFDAHTHMVDSTNGHEFVGTQYSYNTEAEALSRIDAARAADKYVMYADPDNGSYVINEGADDFRVNIED